MAVLLAILGWAGYGVVGAFGLVSVAAGLFYLAELVEEYTVLTKRVLRVIIAVRLHLHSFVSRLLMSARTTRARPCCMCSWHCSRLFPCQCVSLDLQHSSLTSSFSPSFLSASSHRRSLLRVPVIMSAFGCICVNDNTVKLVRAVLLVVHQYLVFGHFTTTWHPSDQVLCAQTQILGANDQSHHPFD